MDTAPTSQAQQSAPESQDAGIVARRQVPVDNIQDLESLPAGYLKNLTSIIVLGVLFSAWFLRYTDWFEIVGGLLALTGLFSWIAFVSKAIPEGRLEALQGWIDEHVLKSPNTFRAVVCIGILGAAVASCLGTIQVEALHDAGSVRITRTGSDSESDEKWELLPAGGRVRSPSWTFWGCPRGRRTTLPS